MKLQKDELKRLQLNLHRQEVLQLLQSSLSFDDLMSMVEKGEFPETSSSFVNAYLQVPPSSRTSLDYSSSIAPSSVPDNDSVMTTVNDVALPVVNLSKFNRNILHDTSDFVVHLWEPADENLAQCLSEAITVNFEDKIDNLVEILQKLRDMASFYLLKLGGATFPRYMDEVTQFQPLVKLFLIHMVEVLMSPDSTISINACQRSRTALNKVITVTSGTQAMLKGQSDLVREFVEECPRYVELKIVGGALYRSSAWQAKDQALGQTVCSSTANGDRVLAIGALMDLFTVSVIVTVPIEDSTNVMSHMSKRITDARSWVLRVALLLVAPTDGISQLLPPFSNGSVIEVHNDAVGDADVGGLNLGSTDISGVTGSSSSSSAPLPPVSEKNTEVDADDRNWLAREALRARHEEKVRQMLEADALLDGFRYLSKENLDNAGRTAIMRPRGDPCRAFGDNLY